MLGKQRLFAVIWNFFFLMKYLGSFANVEEWQPCSPKEAFHTADTETSLQSVPSGEWGRAGRLR